MGSHFYWLQSLFFSLLLREDFANPLHFLVNVIIKLLLIGEPRVPSNTLTPVCNTPRVATGVIISIEVLVDLLFGKCSRGRLGALGNRLVSNKRLANSRSRAKESVFARDTEVISRWTVTDGGLRNSGLLPNKAVELAKVDDTDMRPNVGT